MLFPTPERIMDRIRIAFGAKTRYQQAAALPWRITKDGVEIMLITSRGTGRWILPKGWPEAGEQLCETAAREAQEEAGLVGRVSAGEAGRYRYVKCTRTGREKPCEVSVFPLKVEDAKPEWGEKAERTRQWVSPDKAAGMVAEPELRRLIARFVRNPRRFAA